MWYLGADDATEDLNGAIRNHFVGIHVGLRPRTCLPYDLFATDAIRARPVQLIYFHTSGKCSSSWPSMTSSAA